MLIDPPPPPPSWVPMRNRNSGRVPIWFFSTGAQKLYDQMEKMDVLQERQHEPSEH